MDIVQWDRNDALVITAQKLAAPMFQVDEDQSVVAINPIRVMAVDDHELVRNGLVMCLADYGQVDVVGQAASGPDAIRQVAAIQPDIILMDLRMPGLDGIQTMELIRNQHPGVSLIVLTAYADQETVRARSLQKLKQHQNRADKTPHSR